MRRLVLLLAVAALLSPVARAADERSALRWQAESLRAVASEKETKHATDAASRAYVYLPKGQKSATGELRSRLETEFRAAPGYYQLRVRALATSGGSDSFHVLLNGRHVTTLGLREHGKWVWRETDVRLDSEGPHKLVLAAREPSRIDAVELIPTPGPTGTGRIPAPHIRQNAPVRPEPNGLSAIDVNPPTFRWAGDWRKPYTLQLRRPDQTWERGVTVEGIAATYHRPLGPLEPGKWEWRVRAKGGEWIGPTTFEIDAKTACWAIPPWEKSFAKLSREHPRILTSAAELPALRRKAAGPLKDFMAQWAKRLRKQIGAELPLTGQEQRKDHSKDPRAKTMQRVTSKTEVIRLIGSVGQMAFLSVLLDRDDFAQEAIRRTMFAASLDPEGYTSHAVSDFANGRIVRNAAIAYDLLHDRLTGDQRKAIRKMIHARLFHFRPKLEQRPFSAHGWQFIMGDLSIGAIAIWDEDPEALEWLKWSARAFVAFYPWFGGADGGSAEGMGYYTGTNLCSALGQRMLWKRAIGVDLAEHPWYRNTARFMMYGHPPGQPASQFSDHSPAAGPPNDTKAAAAMILGDWFRDPHAIAYGQAVAAGMGGRTFRSAAWNGYLIPELWVTEGPFGLPSEALAEEGQTKPSPLTELPHGRAFRDVGVAYLHSAMADPKRNVFFEFRCSPYASYNHAHADQNSFNITAFGERIVVDSGYYTSYGDEHHAGWTIQTKAHNTILVDGKGQTSRVLAAYGRIVGFEQGADWAWIAGEAARAYRDPPMKRFRRQVVWLEGADVQTYVIFDSLVAADGKPHAYSWLLHTPTKPAIDAKAQHVDVRGETARARVTWLSPAGLAISVTDKFDPPAENWRPDKQKYKLPNQWHLTAVPRSKAPAQTFLTVIQVTRIDADAKPPAPTAAGATAVRIGNTLIRFTDESAHIQRSDKTIFDGAIDGK
jgi:hypothetical protein